jgi:hypothetical protein
MGFKHEIARQTFYDEVLTNKLKNRLGNSDVDTIATPRNIL